MMEKLRNNPGAQSCGLLWSYGSHSARLVLCREMWVSRLSDGSAAAESQGEVART